MQAEAWSRVFEIAPTSGLVVPKALALVRDHGFQVWDAVIWSAAKSADVDTLLSEDMQGLMLDGVHLVNPFPLSEEGLDRLFH
jgi:predicted nucleic acid-binding protein